MVKTIEYYMEQALKEAEKGAKLEEVPVGCIVVVEGKIVARAHNTKEKSQLISRHAEIAALEKLSKKNNTWRAEGATVYVTLEPCAMCASALLQARVDKVVYGAKEPKGGALGSTFDLYSIKGFNHYPEVVGGVLEEASANLLKEFFKNKRIKKNNSANKPEKLL